MLSRFLSLFNMGVRAYKVQDVKRGTRIGVVAKSFNELVTKGCEKLEIPKEEVTVVIEDDGTVVDDEAFFKKLPAQTVFIFLRPGETWRGAGVLIYDALSKLYNAGRKDRLADQIRQMLTDEEAPEKISIMSHYLDELESNASAEHRYDDEEWFEGVNKKYKTKSELLKHSAQTRIRSYYTTAKDQIEKDTKGDSREELLEVMDTLLNHLKLNEFQGQYFVRTAPSKERMCDKKGWFKCEGPFDQEECEKYHTVNPYASKGYRQLFGLWNLDHIIEKSREVIPTLIQAAENKPKTKELHWEHAYKLLFTRENLKLVQIGCHKKAARDSGRCSVDDFLK